LHKKIKESEIMQKLARNRSLEAKGEILWGREKMKWPCFIEVVGSPFGQIINPVWMRVAL
jgi:hypothetical protein